MLLTQEYTNSISKEGSFLILYFMEDFHKSLTLSEVRTTDSVFILDVLKGVWFIPGHDTEEDIKNGTHTSYYVHSEMVDKINELKSTFGKTLLKEGRWNKEGELESVEKYSFEITSNNYIKEYWNDIAKKDRTKENQAKIDKFMADKKNAQDGGVQFV